MPVSVLVVMVLVITEALPKTAEFCLLESQGLPQKTHCRPLKTSIVAAQMRRPPDLSTSSLSFCALGQWDESNVPCRMLII